MTTIRKMGVIAPKGRRAFAVHQCYTGPSAYAAGRGPSDYEVTQVWARNAKDAHDLAESLDTRAGTGVGWETIGCLPC